MAPALPNGSLSTSSTTAGKVITCRAAVAWGPREPLTIEPIEVDPPRRLEVRLKILFTSICHTDLSAWLGLNEAQRAFPRILGHEASGMVESVGEGVEELEEGDHVILLFNGECGRCACCVSEKTNLCEKYMVDPMRSTMRGDDATRFSIGGRCIYHFMNTSTFTEYTVVDAGCAVKVDKAASLDKVCLLSCGVTTGVGAAWNTADVQEGSTVAVFGLGAVGLAVVQGARMRGASRIFGVDVNPEKSEKGKEMGITDFVNPKDYDKPMNEVLKEMTRGGVDHSFECVGNLDVLRQAFLSTHEVWGTTVMLGIHLTPGMLPLHPMELFTGRRITGSVFGDVKGKTQLPLLVDKCLNGELKLEGFITHELPFEKINEAFKLLEEGKSLRCVLHM